MGADITVADYSGDTPLYVAACSGNEAVIRLRLDKSATVEAMIREESQLLAAAAVSGDEAAFRLMLAGGPTSV